eukprot:5670686-Pyramimonas_sp.AAC.1
MEPAEYEKVQPDISRSSRDKIDAARRAKATSGIGSELRKVPVAVDSAAEAVTAASSKCNRLLIQNYRVFTRWLS